MQVVLREPYNRESRPARRRLEQQVTQIEEEKSNSRLFNQFPIVSFLNTSAGSYYKRQVILLAEKSQSALTSIPV